MAAPGTHNEPLVAPSDPFNPPGDMNAISAWAKTVGNLKTGTRADRLGLTGADLWNGLYFVETDTPCEWVRRSGAWALANQPLFADATERDNHLDSPEAGMWCAQLDDEARYFYDGTEWLAFDTQWQTFAPSFTAGITVGNGTLSGWRFRQGKYERRRVYFRLGSTSAVTAQIVLSVPAQENSIALEQVGWASFRDESAGGNFPNGVVYKISATTVGVYAANIAATYPALAGTTSTVPFTWANTDIMVLHFELWLA